MPEMPKLFKPPTAQGPKVVDTTRLPSQFREMKQRQRPPDPGMERLMKASDGALDTHERLMGTPKLDPDVKLYMGLSQGDLQKMSEQYGVDAVGKYVLTMESRRMGGR